MHFRKATVSDADFISEALKDILALHATGRGDIFRPCGAKYDKNAVIKLLSEEDKHLFVAVEGETVCGYAICYINIKKDDPVLKDRTVFYLDDLYILPSFRGKGSGKAFMDHLLDYAKQLDCDSFELNVWEFDGSATVFYKKCGMTTQRRIMEKPLK